LARRLFIESSSNVRLKAARRLARKGSRALVVVDGSRALRAALAAGAHVREVYASPELYFGEWDAPLVTQAEQQGAHVVELSERAFRTLARGARPDGVLALVERPPADLDLLRLGDEPLLVVAAGIERPGNLGTIIRSACAAGVDAVVVADPQVDLFHRDVVRGSVGAVFRVPVARATGHEAIAWLRGRGIAVVATTPTAATTLWDAELAGGVAIVFGAERHGLSAAWLDAADEHVAIPMPGPGDSLNVAVAAGIVLFEAVRARCASAPDRAFETARSAPRSPKPARPRS
jgi:TrmH family RNA methyltransferase